MIEMMRYVDSRFTLTFMLMENDAGYMRELKEAASSIRSIDFIKPVPMLDICRSINSYDIGIYLLPPKNFNQKYALPNKIFEFIQASLVVAIGPSPEMASIVKRYSCGIVADTFDPREMANRLNGLTEENVRLIKGASEVAARELNYDTSRRTLLDEMDMLSR
jgi:hypothetical protein